MIKMMVKINLAVTLLSKFCNSGLSGHPNGPCNLTGMPNVDQGVAHVVSKQKLLQLNSMLLALNTRFRLPFL